MQEHLVCPVTRRPVVIENGQISAPGSAFSGSVRDGVAVMLETVPSSFFDDKFSVMVDGHDERAGEWLFAYDKQINLIHKQLSKPGLVVDIGCGPTLPYQKPPEALLIGIEYSFPSIAANKDVDLKVCASATNLPLADQSVDTIICLYSIHHMNGSSVEESVSMIRRVVQEFARVVKPGGKVMIFEMAPISPFGAVELLSWNLAKKILGPKLDMFFWPQAKFRALVRESAPECKFACTTFSSPLPTTFPPIFSLPWLRIPRFLYPLSPVLYELSF